MKFGSLFSGIGGIDLGLERAGMECAWQVEWNEWCRKVLHKHWTNIPQYGDITELTGNELEPVDLICGGFPCQPVSVAARRLAQDDPRWLWPHFARLIRILRPRYALMENVPGLLSAGFGDVLGDLAEIGYDAEWECIPAATFGAPHLRYRVFIVAYPNGVAVRSEQVFGAEREGTTITGDDGEDRSMAHSGRESAGYVKRPIFVNAPHWNETAGDAGKCGGPNGRTWATEPDVGRVADGVPSRVDRLRGLGNAVVPQVAEYVGRQIMLSEIS